MAVERGFEYFRDEIDGYLGGYALHTDFLSHVGISSIVPVRYSNILAESLCPCPASRSFNSSRSSNGGLRGIRAPYPLL